MALHGNGGGKLHSRDLLWVSMFFCINVSGELNFILYVHVSTLGVCFAYLTGLFGIYIFLKLKCVCGLLPKKKILVDLLVKLSQGFKKQFMWLLM